MQLENLTLLCKEQFWLQAWTLSSLHFGPNLLLPDPTAQRITKKNIRVSSSNAKIAHVSYLYAHEDVVFKESSRKAEYWKRSYQRFLFIFSYQVFFFTNPNEITLSKKKKTEK